MQVERGQLGPEEVLNRIALRKAERAFLIGGSGSGKTEWEENLILWFWGHYPRSQILILDSKPRFRALWKVDGTSAKRLYKNWLPARTLLDSVAIGRPKELDDVWRSGHRIAIAQSFEASTRPTLVAVAEYFFNSQKPAKHERLLVVDETGDFFRNNSSRIGQTDALERTSRSGREKNIAAVYACQHAKGIPSDIIRELKVLYGFRLDSAGDAKRGEEMGVPPTFTYPENDWEFKAWFKDRGPGSRRLVYGPYRLAL